MLYKDLPKIVRNFKDFVAVDVYSGDSDPVYWAVDGARRKWGYDWAARFCVAMLAYYHTGTAAKAADYEGKEFWDYLFDVFPSNPRGSARRHFRGDAGMYALSDMRNTCPTQPEIFFELFPPHYAGVKKRCEQYLGQCGPYFQLKICDFMDRCLDLPIKSYDGLARNLPSEPAKCLQIEGWNFQDLCKQAEDWDIMAAPDFKRPVGPAEIETSLCGWKTTKYKGNWFGADIADKWAALTGYGEKAHEMQAMMPPPVPKNTFICEL